MKILVLQNGWAGAGISGGDKHLLDLCEILNEKNEVSLMVPRQGLNYINDNWQISSRGINILELTDFTAGRKVTSSAGLILLYLQRTFNAFFKIRQIGPTEIIISSSHFIYDVLPAVFFGIFRRATKVAYVYHLLKQQKRALSFRNIVSVGLEAVSLLFIKRAFQLVVTDNRITYGELVKLGVPANRLVLSKIGIKRPTPVILKKEKVYDLVYLGRISRLKGIYDLLKIVEFIKKKREDVSLAVYGRGEELDGAVSACQNLNIGQNVKFWGFVSDEKKLESLAQGRIFVLPSYEEGWGISLAEAMSLGLPVVVYDLPEVRDVFGDGPLYSPLGNWRDLAARVERLLSDSEYYEEKSQQSRNCVREYYLDSTAFKEFELLGIKT